MRFLAKRADSAIREMRYLAGGHNEALRAALLEEQSGYCAYSEKRISPLDTSAVEHFNPRKKDTEEDGYSNYYCSLQLVNQRKRRREKIYEHARFFSSLFFQEPGALAARITYVAGEGRYEEQRPDDEEARDLIAYLGFNDAEVFEERSRHIRRLRDLFAQAGWDQERQRAWLENHPEEYSFPTALSAELDLDC